MASDRLSRRRKVVFRRLHTVESRVAALQASEIVQDNVQFIVELVYLNQPLRPKVDVVAWSLMAGVTVQPIPANRNVSRSGW